MSNAAPPGPSHDLRPSLIHSWAQFWELRWGWLSWGGWGALAWERRPRPEAQTPWHAQPSCQDAGDSRPPVAPAQPLQLRGICCSEQMQLGDFLCLCWLRAGGPGFSPGGAGAGLASLPGRLHRGPPLPPAQIEALGLEALGRREGGPSVRGLALPAGSIAYWAPTQSTAPLPPPQPPVPTNC